MSNQGIPQNINTICSRQVTRIKKKLSKLILNELCGRQYGELPIRSWEWKGVGLLSMFWKQIGIQLYYFLATSGSEKVYTWIYHNRYYVDHTYQ